MAPQKRITIEITDDYTQDLRVRLKKYGISHGELAREIDMSASQMSRWFTTDLQPRMDNVVKIEKAIAALRGRKGRVRNDG